MEKVYEEYDSYFGTLSRDTESCVKFDVEEIFAVKSTHLVPEGCCRFWY